MSHFLGRLGWWALLSVVSASALAEAPGNSIPPGPETYLGRRIAHTMHWLAADWLTRTEREREEATGDMIRALKLKPGMVVADVGCGNGYHTLMMAEKVGPDGHVWGSDIQPEMITLLDKRATDAGVTNITSVTGTLIDPKLPAGRFDVILLADAYHEFSHPVQMLAALSKSLKPQGRLALLEFRAEDDSVPIKPDHKMSRAQIEKELKANGFRLDRSYDALPWQHLMFFVKDPSP